MRANHDCAILNLLLKCEDTIFDQRYQILEKVSTKAKRQDSLKYYKCMPPQYIKALKRDRGRDRDEK